MTVSPSEDMIDLLGKRPFVNRADDMDKWLDEHGSKKRGESSAPPPPPEESSGSGGTPEQNMPPMPAATIVRTPFDEAEKRWMSNRTKLF
jgi:AFG3 family protein